MGSRLVEQTRGQGDFNRSMCAGVTEESRFVRKRQESCEEHTTTRTTWNRSVELHLISKSKGFCWALKCGLSRCHEAIMVWKRTYQECNDPVKLPNCLSSVRTSECLSFSTLERVCVEGCACMLIASSRGHLTAVATSMAPRDLRQCRLVQHEREVRDASRA